MLPSPPWPSIMGTLNNYAVYLRVYGITTSSKVVLRTVS